MNILQANRREIITLLVEQQQPFHGEMELLDFLANIWDLKSKPIPDAYYKDLESGIIKHMFNNSDWSDEELLINQLNLLECPDEKFIEFLEKTMHPDILLNEENLNLRLNLYNEKLQYSNFTLQLVDYISGIPIYKIIAIDKLHEQIIRFYKVPWKRKLPSNAVFPCVKIMEDNWNDHNYFTYFHISYYDSKKTEHLIGGTKILEKGKKKTTLPNQFNRLDSEYCSLGQNIDYYQVIDEIGREAFIEILSSLNDIALNPVIAKNFEEEPGFSISLLRYSDAEKAFKEGRNYLFPEAYAVKNFMFTFTYKLINADEKHKIDFDFRKSDYLPHRINLLIGENGTGKTQLLANLAQLISGDIAQNNNFFPERPSFSKIIALSYSIFDEFYKPDALKQKYGSYKYCGMRNTRGHLDFQSLINELNISKTTIIKLNRLAFWKEILGEFIDDEDFFEESHRFTKMDFSKYSSGQNMFFATITQVIAYIQNDSLLLFDEPETHLHPNAIAKIIRALYKLLTIFDSYAIIATHSPIIAQEIPSKHIRIVERTGNIPSVRLPGIECFGENLTVITNDIFYTGEVSSIHEANFRELSKKLTYEKILDVFDNKLSFNAKMMIKAMISEEQKEC